MDDTALVSFSLTHVRYDPNDRFSLAGAWLALVPQALCIIYVTLIWSTREIEVGMMFAGQMACEGLNYVLKRWIKEERPMKMNGKGYGMPSSHAQFMAFFAVSLTLFLLVRHKPRPLGPSSTHSPLGFQERAAISLMAIVGAMMVAASRTYLNYHTPKQVLVGCGAGAASAVAWFVATGVARRVGLVDWTLQLSIVRRLRIRDLVVHEDFVEAGWEKYEMSRRRPIGNGKKLR